ncbi:MAG: small multi-drug export protein, partial [Elusimicrobiota bacterium]
HLVNIPISLFAGLGKYFAFAIAVVIDLAQMILYYNVLNKTRMGLRFGWTINNKLFTDYKKPELLTRFHHNWIYLGIGLLSLLPIYFGGMFAAVFTAHVLKLHKAKSYIFIGIGSIIGCFIWTIGIWSAAGFVIGLFKHI